MTDPREQEQRKQIGPSIKFELNPTPQGQSPDFERYWSKEVNLGEPGTAQLMLEKDEPDTDEGVGIKAYLLDEKGDVSIIDENMASRQGFLRTIVYLNNAPPPVKKALTCLFWVDEHPDRIFQSELRLDIVRDATIGTEDVGAMVWKLPGMEFSSSPEGGVMFVKTTSMVPRFNVSFVAKKSLGGGTK